MAQPEWALVVPGGPIVCFSRQLTALENMDIMQVGYGTISAKVGDWLCTTINGQFFVLSDAAYHSLFAIEPTP